MAHKHLRWHSDHEHVPSHLNEFNRHTAYYTEYLKVITRKRYRDGVKILLRILEKAFML